MINGQHPCCEIDDQGQQPFKDNPNFTLMGEHTQSGHALLYKWWLRRNTLAVQIMTEQQHPKLGLFVWPSELMLNQWVNPPFPKWQIYPNMFTCLQKAVQERLSKHEYSKRFSVCPNQQTNQSTYFGTHKPNPANTMGGIAKKKFDFRSDYQTICYYLIYEKAAVL